MWPPEIFLHFFFVTHQFSDEEEYEEDAFARPTTLLQPLPAPLLPGLGLPQKAKSPCRCQAGTSSHGGLGVQVLGSPKRR